MEAEEDHANFVKINLAYSVLSKRESRVEYDLGLAGDRLDPASNYKGETTTRYYKPANFEERANIYGYYQDPRYNFQTETTYPTFSILEEKRLSRVEFVVLVLVFSVAGIKSH